MDKLVLNGGRRLRGEVKISGSKNATLPMMCASLLTPDHLELENVPHLRDVTTMLALLGQIGVQVSLDERSRVGLNASQVHRLVASYDLVKTMRASILVLGPMLARFGEACVSLPGGCAIGQRPVDQHIKGLEAMGADIYIDNGYIHAKAKIFRGAEIKFDMVSVTGTENLMMAATLASGTTVIKNAAREPEVVDLANCLGKMGAKISGAGTGEIVVEGVKKLNGGNYSVMPDRIETGTFMVAAAMAGGKVTVSNGNLSGTKAIMLKLQEAGCKICIRDDKVVIEQTDRLKGVSLETAPFPFFPTDMQAQFMAMNSVSVGLSNIKETIFENRFMHAQELRRLGANISISGNVAKVNGVKKLRGARVMATDLRASACLVLAGLVAEGQTIIDRIYHLDRGYERIEEKLVGLGAVIKRSN